MCALFSLEILQAGAAKGLSVQLVMGTCGKPVFHGDAQLQ